MRPLPTLSLILLAALGGGVAARLLTLGPADDGSPEALVQTATSAALPALASAAPPTPVVGGAECHQAGSDAAAQGGQHNQGQGLQGAHGRLPRLKIRG